MVFTHFPQDPSNIAHSECLTVLDQSDAVNKVDIC